MARRAGQDLAVGAMAALALVVLAFGVMAVGEQSGWLRKRVTYAVSFDGADGLLVGAPVKMNGVQIGTVSEIVLPTDPQQSGIRVELAISPSYAPRIRADSRASLRILQLLTNEKFVEVTSGHEGPALAPGAEIQLLEETGVLERGEAIAENLSEITIALKRILGPLEQGQGIIGQALQDPEFGRRGLEALGATLENLEQLTGELRAGRGTLGLLLYDDALAERIGRVGEAIEDVAAVAQAVREREGALGALLQEGGPAERAIGDLQASAAGLRRMVERLEGDRGLVGRLLNDTEYSEELAGNLARTLVNVAEITEKINHGEGSLGVLINDSTLTDSAQEVVAGVNDSKFARWLIRHYRKKGIKAADEEPAAETAQPADVDGP